MDNGTSNTNEFLQFRKSNIFLLPCNYSNIVRSDTILPSGRDKVTTFLPHSIELRKCEFNFSLSQVIPTSAVSKAQFSFSTLEIQYYALVIPVHLEL